MTGFTFQSLKPQDSLSNELRSVIRDNVLQFYAKGLSAESEEEGLTALYERLSQEDKLDGESNSIANQKKILEGSWDYRLPPLRRGRRLFRHKLRPSGFPAYACRHQGRTDQARHRKGHEPLWARLSPSGNVYRCCFPGVWRSFHCRQ